MPRRRQDVVHGRDSQKRTALRIFKTTLSSGLVFNDPGSVTMVTENTMEATLYKYASLPPWTES
jgi:hypothetical protein